MNEVRDPALERLFSQAETDLVDEAMTNRVMDRLSRRRRNVILGRAGIVVAIIAFELLLSAPLNDRLGAFMRVLSASLIEIEGEWLAAIAAPLNSAAGLIGLLLLGLHLLFRRLMR